MTKDVLVTISGLLSSPDDSEDTIEVTTAGQYYFKNGKHYILYDEIGESVNEVIKNMIIITDNHVDVRKKGAIDTQMSFENGKKLNSFYTSMFGQMELGISTDSIEMAQEECRLELNLKYHLDINNEHVSDNRIHVLVQAME